MVIQYPDTASIPAKPGEAVLQEDGTYQTGTPGDAIQQKGRYEPSTLNREQQLADGSKVILKGIFYMPLSSEDVDVGVDFTVTNRLGDLVLTTKVLFFTRGQLNCRVFL